MADIALVFGWTPDVMNPMPVGELMQWRAKAAKRHNPKD
ncbi:MAG TPA: GpE family phage tail protein [Sphingomonas sp.]|nr:GpE family phage tail protein [Sphingomonas sp.]